MTEENIERLIADVLGLVHEKRYHDAENLADVVGRGNEEVRRRVLLACYPYIKPLGTAEYRLIREAWEARDLEMWR